MNLLPCPFCGGEAKLVNAPNNTSYWLFAHVTCTQCCAETAMQDTPTQAAEKWNQRTPKVEVALTEPKNTANEKVFHICIKCYEPIKLVDGKWEHMWMTHCHVAEPTSLFLRYDQNHNNA